MIDIQLIIQSLPYLLRGTLVTIEIALLSCAIGLVLGTLCGLALTSTNWIIRALTGLYTTIFRGTPMLIQIIFVAFLLPSVGISISAFWGVVWAIGLNSGAYIAYIIKSGITSVSAGQREAGKTLGLSKIQIIRYIVLPQAIRVALPALGNEFITLVKDSSLGSFVGVQELAKEGEIISSQTFDALTVYVIVAIFYLVITSILTFGMTLIEGKMNYHARH